MDREKVIKGLKHCLSIDSPCGDCPYYSYDDIQELECERNLRNDALAMLKEQEKQGKWERHYSRPGVYADLFWWCSVCGEPTRYNDAGIFYQYCPHCGAKLEPCKET